MDYGGCSLYAVVCHGLRVSDEALFLDGHGQGTEKREKICLCPHSDFGCSVSHTCSLKPYNILGFMLKSMFFKNNTFPKNCKVFLFHKETLQTFWRSFSRSVLFLKNIAFKR